MKIRKILASLGLALVLILTSVAVFAGPPEGMFPPPGMPPMMGPAMMGPAMATDKQHLYVLAGPKITQFSLGDLKLLKSVDLPKPRPPKEKADMPFPPPLFHPWGAPRGCWSVTGPFTCWPDRCSFNSAPPIWSSRIPRNCLNQNCLNWNSPAPGSKAGSFPPGGIGRAFSGAGNYQVENPGKT